MNSCVLILLAYSGWMNKSLKFFTSHSFLPWKVNKRRKEVHLTFFTQYCQAKSLMSFHELLYICTSPKKSTICTISFYTSSIKYHTSTALLTKEKIERKYKLSTIRNIHSHLLFVIMALLKTFCLLFGFKLKYCKRLWIWLCVPSQYPVLPIVIVIVSLPFLKERDTIPVRVKHIRSILAVCRRFAEIL